MNSRICRAIFAVLLSLLFGLSYVSADPAAKYQPPQNVSAERTPKGVLIKWDPVAGAKGYLIQRGTSERSITTNFPAGATSRSYLDTDSSLKLDTVRYFYQVVWLSEPDASDADNWSNPSTQVFVGNEFILLDPINGHVPTPLSHPTFRWSTAKAATRYSVEYGPLNKTPLTKTVTTTSTTMPYTFWFGQTYQWQVKALAPSTQPLPAGNGPQTFAPVLPDIHLARSYPGAFNELATAMNSSGASVLPTAPSQSAAVSANGENPVSWTLDGAVYWFGDKIFPIKDSISPVVSYEAHIAGNDKSNQNTLQLRAGLAYYHLIATDDDKSQGYAPYALGFETDADYSTDKEFETQEMTSDNFLSLNWPAIALDKDLVRLLWYPLVGFQVGQQLRRPERDNGQSWFVFRPEVRFNGEIDLSGVADALELNKLDIFLDETAVDQPVGRISPRYDNYITAGVEIVLPNNLGFQFAYNYGRAAPTFSQSSGFTVGFSTQF